MKKIKKYVAMASMFAMLGSSAAIAADDCCGTQGCAYEDCRRAPCISPTVALGTIALVGLITVLVHNKSGGHNSHASHAN